MKKEKPKFKIVECENGEPHVLDPNTYIDFIKCLLEVSKAVTKGNEKGKL